ncbi:MAG: hypothetical protein D6807_05265, partial [Alphaproteobacteria bacterium]
MHGDLRGDDGAPALDMLPVLHVGTRSALCLADEEAPKVLAPAASAERLGATPHLLCNLPLVLRRLGLARAIAFDLLELFAFVRPAQFTVPTAAGLLQALDLGDRSGETERIPSLLRAAAQR